jgi:hypothetical protein
MHKMKVCISLCISLCCVHAQYEIYVVYLETLIPGIGDGDKLYDREYNITYCLMFENNVN